MSNVRQRERGTSEIEFLNTAHELELYTIKVVHNEKVIPKRYRLTLGKSLMESARTINQNVTYANSINPMHTKDPELKKRDYQMRREFQKLAVVEIQNLLALMRVVSELLPVKDTVLEEWTGLVLLEEKVVKGWIESDKKRFANL
jgi:hypothetical protein